MLYTIYRSTCQPNGKVYIGFDKNWPTRKKQHENSNNGSHFHNAIRKYGKDAFVWEVIYQSTDGKHCLKVMEPYFIKEYGSFGDGGYNLTYGGEGKKSRDTDETRKRKSVAHTGLKQSKEMVAKRTLILIGQKRTQQTKDNIRLSKIGKKRSLTSIEKQRETLLKYGTHNKGKPLPESQRAALRVPKKKFLCGCGKLVDAANMKRWHQHKEKPAEAG